MRNSPYGAKCFSAAATVTRTTTTTTTTTACRVVKINDSNYFSSGIHHQRAMKNYYYYYATTTITAAATPGTSLWVLPPWKQQQQPLLKLFRRRLESLSLMSSCSSAAASSVVVVDVLPTATASSSVSTTTTTSQIDLNDEENEDHDSEHRHRNRNNIQLYHQNRQQHQPRLQALRQRLASERNKQPQHQQQQKQQQHDNDNYKHDGHEIHQHHHANHNNKNDLDADVSSFTFNRQVLRNTNASSTTTTTSNPILNPPPRLSSELMELILRLRDTPTPNMTTRNTKRGASSFNNSSFDAMPLSSQQQQQQLQDRFHRHHSYLRISLVEKCNLRCTYCMPPDGLPHLHPTSSLLSATEIIDLASLFVQTFGISKIRLTGGEPLLRPDLVPILYGLRHIPQQSLSTTTPSLEQLGMTTNGISLARQLPALVDAGLTHLNISLDTLNATKFEHITRRKGWHHVWRSIEMACDMYVQQQEKQQQQQQQQDITASSTFGLQRIKLNCVIMRGVNDDEMQDFCRLTLQYPMLDVRFIEWMPFANNGWQTNHLVPFAEMKQIINNNEKHTNNNNNNNNKYVLQRLADGPNDTTKWYQWVERDESLETTGAAASRLLDRGRIGFISSMTDHFCATCNRLRLTADGQFKVCLFGTREVNLRDVLRNVHYHSQQQQQQQQQDTDRLEDNVVVTIDDLQRLITHAVWQKDWALGGHDSASQLQEHADDNRPMVLIGG